jgi:hypothetical protein
MALQPLVWPWPLFQFLNLHTYGMSSWTNNTNTQQCSSGSKIIVINNNNNSLINSLFACLVKSAGQIYIYIYIHIHTPTHTHTLWLPFINHISRTHKTEYTRHEELVCYAWKNSSSSSAHLQLAEYANGTRFHAMCFPASGMSQKELHQVQPHFQLLDAMVYSLHSPKRKKSSGVIQEVREEQGARNWSVTHSACKTFIQRLWGPVV